MLIALVSGFFSIILGVLGAIGTFYSKKRIKKIINFLTTIPIANAEIVTALSLAMFFVFLNSFLNLEMQLFAMTDILLYIFSIKDLCLIFVYKQFQVQDLYRFYYS